MQNNSSVKEVCVRKVVISERCFRWCVTCDGLPVVGFPASELYRAQFVASNLIFALYRLQVSPEHIALYE